MSGNRNPTPPVGAPLAGAIGRPNTPLTGGDDTKRPIAPPAALLRNTQRRGALPTPNAIRRQMALLGLAGISNEEGGTSGNRNPVPPAGAPLAGAIGRPNTPLTAGDDTNRPIAPPAALLQNNLRRVARPGPQSRRPAAFRLGVSA